MNKALSKTIMLTSKLRNTFKTELRKIEIIIQHKEIHVLHFREKVKREHSGNLDEKNLRDNKKFLSAVKTLLSNKSVSNEIITLLEVNNVLDNNRKTKTILNNFVPNIIKNLSIPQYNEAEH